MKRKVRVLTTLALTVVVLGCGLLQMKTQAPHTEDDLFVQWRQFLSEVKGRPDVVSVTEEYRARKGIPLPFWAESGTKSGRRVEVHDGHPCGTMAYLIVKEIPNPNVQNHFSADLVIELDGQGKPIRRWLIPIDRVVFGIRGNQLIIPLHYCFEEKKWLPLSLAIEPDGTFHITDFVEYSDPKLVECPELTEFAGSAYLRCWEYRDQVSGKIRTLAYQGPCT